jgi:nucleoside-diphosphate kinase
MSKTLAFLKPDTACNPYIVQRVIQRLDQENLKIVQSKSMQWTLAQSQQFYSAHREKFFYNRLCGMLSSGPFIALALEGDDCVAKWRNIIGPTHLLTAKLTDPTSLRALFATSDTRNGFHGSDAESVEQEINIVFPELEIIYRSKSKT